ncbi:unnamed protein product [Heligmosomoides polygyrus]|uniref:Retrotransposon protein, putative, unclassified n=1 Tax=Heligmosomoides polygyrus TaxID=6339 RepID=A0A183GM47_HELPZ|nr:unnamed protein product [Heligmosomoides polygyrus]
MERMMNVVYGMPPPIRYRNHVRPMIKDVLKKYDHEIYYFCNSCSGLLAGRRVEFVKAAATSTIARYSYDGFDDVDPKSFQTLITVASQLILTDPPTAIQGYAVRVSGRAGRNTKLKHLPEDVEDTLIGTNREFALDMLGYGRSEITCPGDVNLAQSSRDVRNNSCVEVNGVPTWLSNSRQKKLEEQQEEVDKREIQKEEDQLEST